MRNRHHPNPRGDSTRHKTDYNNNEHQRRRHEHQDNAYFRINFSDITRRKFGLNQRQQIALFVALLLCVFSLWFLTPLPDMVAMLVLSTVPLESDVELGIQSLRSLSRQYPPVKDDQWGVADIGEHLISQNAHLISPEYRFTAEVISAPFVNAFALPGGVVRVTDTLLNTLNLSPFELAALLGHEIGHVVHRHSQRRSIKRELLQTILGALVYDDRDDHEENFGEAVGEILQKSAVWLGEQSFSRKDEYEADAMAWDLLVGAGMDPRALQSLLRKLWKLEGGSGVTKWESTHPGTKDRIEALQEKWNDLPWKQKRRFAS